ncbi:MAG TPA: HD domain-containing phosphohydrolase [Anaeromyxobacteraceae bacterium]|nr:HD domain-containing phosphohydrolase [Anaeromyxobacteraceae bacterium]
MKLAPKVLALAVVAAAVPAVVLGVQLALTGHPLLALASGAASVAFAALLAAAFARGLAEPLTELVRGALDIARGRFGRQVPVPGRSEIGDLAYTFNYMSRELARQDAENSRLIEALERGTLEAVRSLAGAIDAKDPYTRGHNGRVAELAVEVGREMGCDATTLQALEYGGLLHDVGKIGVPEALLRKTVPLTGPETSLMRQHPAIGADIVREVELLRDALPAIRSHHERWDGGGYPDGLIGVTIPLVARIVNAADTWDACTSSRPYQPALEPAEVVEILGRLRGTQIDPAVHDALLAVLHRRTNGAIGKVRGAA